MRSMQRKVRGGARPGAGRKPRGPERRERINITLSPAEQRRARWLGEGNLSLGIARALETCPDWARKLE